MWPLVLALFIGLPSVTFGQDTTPFDQMKISDSALTGSGGSISFETRQREHQVLAFALNEGYVGRAIHSSQLWERVESRLATLVATDTLMSRSEYCDAIADALWLLPDSHLLVVRAYEEDAVCGNDRHNNRSPSVGENVAHGVEANGKPWIVKHLTVLGQSVPCVGVTEFSSGQEADWLSLRSILSDGDKRRLPVVLDLRGNTGGDDEPAFQLAESLLGQRPQPFFNQVTHFRTGAAWRLKANLAYFKHLMSKRSGGGPSSDDLAEYERLEATAAEAHQNERERIEIVPIERSAKDSNYVSNRSVLVLIDSGCASSCETAVLALRGHSAVRLYGERTAGLIAFGNLGLLVLPESDIGIALPTAHFATRDGESYERVGIPPDVYVEPGDDALDVAVHDLTALLSH
jgi:hypothetical protein